MGEWTLWLHPVLSRTFICNTKTSWTQWIGCQEKIRSRRLAFTTKPTVFIDFSWWIPYKLCKFSGVKDHCFNTISFSLVYLFLASPDVRLIVAPEFILVSPTSESHAHTVLLAAVLLQLSSRALLNCKCNQRESFPVLYQLLPRGWQKIWRISDVGAAMKKIQDWCSEFNDTPKKFRQKITWIY